MNGLYAVYFVILFILHVDENHGIRCYGGYGAGTGTDQSSIIENCAGSCRKTIIKGETSRGCSGIKGGEMCDAAPEITVCYCRTDLCNAASTGRRITFIFMLAPMLAYFFQKTTF